jgi:hypothetical protein
VLSGAIVAVLVVNAAGPTASSCERADCLRRIAQKAAVTSTALPGAGADICIAGVQERTWARRGPRAAEREYRFASPGVPAVKGVGVGAARVPLAISKKPLA